MKNFYMVYIGVGQDVLLTDEKILLVHYSDNTTEYQAFESAAIAVAEECECEIQELHLSKSDQSKVSEMIEEWDCDYNKGEQEFANVVKFILRYARKEAF